MIIDTITHKSATRITGCDSTQFFISWDEQDFLMILAAGKDIFAKYGSDFMDVTTNNHLSELSYNINHHPSITNNNILKKSAVLVDRLNNDGIVILTKIPEFILDNAPDLNILYFSIQCLLGTPCYGNVDKKTIYSITTKQIRQKTQSGNERITNSITPLPFHTDTATFNALLCIEPGKYNGGGENELISAVNVHNYIHAHRPDLLEELYKPCYIDRRGEQLPGSRPYSAIPIFKLQDNLLMTCYTELYNKTAIDKYKLKESNKHKEALEFLDTAMKAVAQEKKITYKPERGNILILNTNLTFHNRLAFQSENRKLLRCWVYSLTYPTFPHIWGYPYE
jgi:hypothetical protein